MYRIGILDPFSHGSSPSLDNAGKARLFLVSYNGDITQSDSRAGQETTGFSLKQQEVRDDAPPNDDRHLEYFIFSSLF